MRTEERLPVWAEISAMVAPHACGVSGVCLRSRDHMGMSESPMQVAGDRGVFATRQNSLAKTLQIALVGCSSDAPIRVPEILILFPAAGNESRLLV